MSFQSPLQSSGSGSGSQYLIERSLEQVEHCLQQPELYNLNPGRATSDPYVFKLNVEGLAIAAKVIVRSRNPLVRLRQESLAEQLLIYQKLHLQWQQFTPGQQSLLSVCSIYGYVQQQSATGIREVLLMEWVNGKPLSSMSGFSREFCQAFQIPSPQAIRFYPQLLLHRAIDPQPERQGVKLQIGFLFHQLKQKGIRIWGLNRSNILYSDGQYVIIDPSSTLLSATRFYNFITDLFISWIPKHD